MINGCGREVRRRGGTPSRSFNSYDVGERNEFAFKMDQEKSTYK